MRYLMTPSRSSLINISTYFSLISLRIMRLSSINDPFLRISFSTAYSLKLFLASMMLTRSWPSKKFLIRELDRSLNFLFRSDPFSKTILSNSFEVDLILPLWDS
jgi:hypothetical protein